MNTNNMKALPLVASMLGDKLGVEVVIGDMKTASTDGKVIMLPALPMCGEEELAALVNGYIDHEAAHIRHTDFEAIKNSRLNPLEKHIENTIEDGERNYRPKDGDWVDWPTRYFLNPAFDILKLVFFFSAVKESYKEDKNV